MQNSKLTLAETPGPDKIKEVIKNLEDHEKECSSN